MHAVLYLGQHGFNLWLEDLSDLISLLTRPMEVFRVQVDDICSLCFCEVRQVMLWMLSSNAQAKLRLASSRRSSRRHNPL